MPSDSSVVVRRLRAVVVLGLVAMGVLAVTGASAQIKLPGLNLDCGKNFDLLIASMSQPGFESTAKAAPAFVLDNRGYGAFPNVDRIARSGNKMVGTMQAVLPGKCPAPGTFGEPPVIKNVPVELYKAADGKVWLKWTIDGATYQSTVDSCQSRLWTAAAGRSGMMVRIAAPLETPK